RQRCGGGSEPTTIVPQRGADSYTVEYEPTPSLYDTYNEPGCHELVRVSDASGAVIADVTVHHRGGRVPTNLLARDAKLGGVSVFEVAGNFAHIDVKGQPVVVHTFGSTANPEAVPLVHVLSVDLPTATIVVHGTDLGQITRFLQTADVSTLLGL